MCKFYDSSLSLEDNEFKDPVFFAQVPWLSCGRVLQRFTIHLTSIQNFLKTEEMLTSYSIIKDQKKKNHYHTAYEWAKFKAPRKGKPYLWSWTSIRIYTDIKTFNNIDQ